MYMSGARVALRNDSYALHILLPSKIDPLVSLMKVEKVPDSTYDMIGGCDQQIKEIKEVRGLFGGCGQHGGDGGAGRLLECDTALRTTRGLALQHAAGSRGVHLQGVAVELAAGREDYP
jgi:hypothetical protein